MRKSALYIIVMINALIIWIIVDSIKTDIDTNLHTDQMELKISDKLEFIREFQHVYKSQNISFAPSWSELKRFARNDSIYTISTKEIVEFDQIGQNEKVYKVYDTLASVSVYDSIFMESIYDIRDLQSIPGFADEEFMLLTDIINVQGVDIEVIKVECPFSVDPKDKDKKLSFGSIESPTLADNW